jgi:hypothetical protein
MDKTLLEKYLSGLWSTEDIIEVAVDEISMAGSVAGMDKPLVTKDEDVEKDLQLEKALQDYYYYNRRFAGDLNDFVETCMPGVSDLFISKLKAQIK